MRWRDVEARRRRRYHVGVVVRALPFVLALLFATTQVASVNVCRCTHDGPCTLGSCCASPRSVERGSSCCSHKNVAAGSPRAPERREPCRQCGCVAKETFVPSLGKVALPAGGGAVLLVAPSPTSAAEPLAHLVSAEARRGPGAGPPSVPSSASPSLLPVRLD